MNKNRIIFSLISAVILSSLTIGCSENKNSPETEVSQSSYSEYSESSNGYDSPEEVINALYEIANESMAEPFDKSAENAAEKIYDLYYEPEIEMNFGDLSKGKSEVLKGYTSWVNDYYNSIKELDDPSIISSWQVRISEPHEETDILFQQERYSFEEIGLEKSNIYKASFAESSDENAREVYILSDIIRCNEYDGKWYISVVG